jgi:hypothetical protein
MRAAGDRVNEWANSMFRFDRLSPAWVDACAGYLASLFGDLRGRTVIDYAFGRGNWSLAFLRAGAARVIAIDAAVDNVRRFSDHCRRHAIQGVEIVHGDVLAAAIPRRADVLWVYGILPGVADPDTLVERLREMVHGPGATSLFYAYDAGSLRQFVVEAARRGVVYGRERDFAEDSEVLTRAARMRARDDLTAPVVNWHSLASVTALLRRHGWHPVARVGSFAEFQHGVTSEEFRPHHLVCGPAPGRDLDLTEPGSPYAPDVAALRALADKLHRVSTPEERRRAGLGLFNTHFSSLGADGAAAPVLIEDFLFLFNLLLRKRVGPEDLAEPTSSLYALAIRGLSDEPRQPLPAAGGWLAGYLAANRIRL